MRGCTAPGRCRWVSKLNGPSQIRTIFASWVSRRTVTAPLTPVPSLLIRGRAGARQRQDEENTCLSRGAVASGLGFVVAYQVPTRRHFFDVRPIQGFPALLPFHRDFPANTR